MSKKTDELDFELKNTDSLDNFIQNNEEEFDDKNFYKFLNQLIRDSGKSKFRIAAESGVSEPYIYNIVNAQKRPTRDTVLKLAFGLKLNLETTERLLKLSSHSALYVRHKRDSIIKFAIEDGMNLSGTDELLIKYGVAPLVGQ